MSHLYSRGSGVPLGLCNNQLFIHEHVRHMSGDDGWAPILDWCNHALLINTAARFMSLVGKPHAPSNQGSCQNCVEKKLSRRTDEKLLVNRRLGALSEIYADEKLGT